MKRFHAAAAAIAPALIALLMTSTMAGAQPRAAGHRLVSVTRFAGLHQAIRQGVLDRTVLRQASRTGITRALVTFDGSAALVSAVGRAPAGSRTARAGAIVRSTRAAYAAMKASALRGLAGVQVLQDYASLPVILVRVRAGSLLSLLNRAGVAGVGADRVVRPTLAQSLPLIRQPQAAAAGYTGTGTAVGVLDTGVDYTRSAFGSCSAPGTPTGCRVVYAHDFAPGDGSLDDDGHGTNVAGIVAGVAPGTSILSMDVFDGSVGRNSYILSAIDFAVTNQSTYNIKALNLSLGSADHNDTACAGSTNPFVSAFANARAVGIVPVVAAGNDAYHNGAFVSGISSPACTPGALSVGAVYDSDIGAAGWGKAPDDCFDTSTQTDQITCFSQSGSLLTMLAPGSEITAAGITESGTSQATPHVAGAVAVLGAANTGASPDQIQSALSSTGPLITDPRNSLARHRLDLPDAVTALGGSFSPSLTVSKSGSGTGTVTSNDSPQTINCGTVCSASYQSGASVTLTATPDNGDTFDGWSGACSGTSTCTVTINTAVGVTATFTAPVPVFQPDALVSADGRTFIGEDVYSPTGAGESVARSVKRGKKKLFYIIASNDGQQTDKVFLKGTVGTGKITIRYFDGTGADVTSFVRSGTGFFNLSPGTYGVIYVVVTVGKFATVGSKKSWKLVETSKGDPTAVDAVIIKVKAIR